jgi:hypothetical protein
MCQVFRKGDFKFPRTGDKADAMLSTSSACSIGDLAAPILFGVDGI